MRRSPLYEVVGQLGMWGMIINAIQAAGLEHKAIREATWSGMNSESRPHFAPSPSHAARSPCDQPVSSSRTLHRCSSSIPSRRCSTAWPPLHTTT